MLRKLIVTEYPERTLWWRLSHFKNVERLASLVRAVHPTASEQNATKQATQVRYCIEQAEEYFRSAEVVSLAVKPLLLYYGMASLAWALILIKKTGDYALDNISTEHQSHGLERPHLTFDVRNMSLSEMLEKVRTTVSQPISRNQTSSELRGTFGLLFFVVGLEPVGVTVERQTGDVTERTTRMFQVHPTHTSTQGLAGSQLSLGRLLLEIPDMASPFTELGVQPLYAIVSDAKITQLPNGTEKMIVLTAGSSAEINTHLRGRLERYEGVTVSEITAGLRLEMNMAPGEEAAFPSMHSALDGRTFVYIYEEPEPLPETCSLLGAMFLLGMLVRYYPHIWMQLLDRRHPLVETVEAFLPLAQRKYPNLILNNLAGDSFVFQHLKGQI